MISFIEAIKKCNVIDIYQMEAIKDALEERYDNLQMQEPDCSNDFFYEKWEEKFNEFEYLKDDFDSLYDELEMLLDSTDFDVEDEDYYVDDEVKNKLNSLKAEYNLWVEKIKDYQYEYGGLKRLKVFF